MSEGQEEPVARDLGLLKSILGSPSESSMTGDTTKTPTQDSEESDGYRESHRRRSKKKMVKKIHANRQVSEESQESQRVVLRLDDWKPDGASDSEVKVTPRDTGHRRNRRTKGKVRVLPRFQYTEPRDNKYDLEQKYEELRDLLSDQYSLQHEHLKRQLVNETKHVVMQRHGLGHLVRPPSAKLPDHRRVKRGHTVHVGVGGPDVEMVNRNEQGEDYILIDATNGSHGTTKHVTFCAANHHSNGIGNTLGSQDEQRGRNATRRVKSASLRGRKVNESRSSSLSSSSSPVTTPKKEKRDCSYGSTSSFESESEPQSRSTSREKTILPSDHQLKNTNNPTIQVWLKKKNKMLKKQRKEKRKESREKRKREAEEIQEKEERHQKSKERVEAWMSEKRKETRLLKKRARQMRMGGLKFEGEVAVEEETVDLKDGAEENKDPEKADAAVDSKCKHECGKGTKKTRPKSGKVNMKGEETLKCTCGFVETIKQKEEELKQNRQAARQRVASARLAQKAENESKATNPRRSHKSPARSKKAAPGPTTPEQVENQTPEEKRISYDDWVKTKRQAEQEKNNADKEQADTLAASTDPADEKLVSEVAQKRIQNIKEGKKKINSGVQRVDDKANAYPEAQESQATGPSYQMEGEAKRPASAQPKAKKAANLPKRPSSAHPVSSAKGPNASKSKTATPLSISYPAPSRKRPQSPTKPEVKAATAYSKVKYQQKSWDNFSEHVWDKLNEEEGEGEDQGSETRPEPQGSDKPDEAIHQEVGAVDAKTSEPNPGEGEKDGEPNVDEPETAVEAEKVVEQATSGASDGEGENDTVAIVIEQEEESQNEQGTSEENAEDTSCSEAREEKHVHFAEKAEIHEEVAPSDNGEVVENGEGGDKGSPTENDGDLEDSPDAPEAEQKDNEQVIDEDHTRSSEEEKSEGEAGLGDNGEVVENGVAKEEEQVTEEGQVKDGKDIEVGQTETDMANDGDNIAVAEGNGNDANGTVETSTFITETKE